MKKLAIYLFVICLFASAHPQQFSRLNGLEDPQGQTILLYSLGIDNSGRFSPVYKYDVDSGIETKIMDAYSNVIDTSYTNSKSIGDYEYFPNDINNFINVGLIFDAVTQGYAARNDTITFTDWAFFFVDISNEHPHQVYISDFHKIYRSFDGGYTYPADSAIDFEFLSVADFDDRVFFGTDNNRLIKSEDQGTTFSIVDTSDIQTSMPGRAFYYDVNQYHIYRLNKSYNKFTLNVSNNKGNAFTWTKTYESDQQFFITIDSIQSGVVFLADGRKIYKSINNGYTFSEYKSLPSKLVGIYKKPNSEILYAASKCQLYEIKPDTINIIKSVPISPYDLSYYPLKVGNKWIYSSSSVDFNPLPNYYYWIGLREVLKDTLLSNGKKYFKIYDNTTLNSTKIFFERIDTSTGLVYRFDEGSSGNPNEYLIDDLLSEVGDTILSYRDMIPITDLGYCVCVERGITNLFEKIRAKKSFRKFNLSNYSYNLVSGVGLDSIYNSFDFGNSLSKIKGCIIDGIVFGDTTLTDIDNQANSIPTEYKLEQNYPNPFNPSTKISWQSPVGSWQTLKVYDVLGREVTTLVDEYRNAGSYDIEFDASILPSGVYFYQLKAGEFVETKKMMFLK